MYNMLTSGCSRYENDSRSGNFCNGAAVADDYKDYNGSPADHRDESDNTDSWCINGGTWVWKDPIQAGVFFLFMSPDNSTSGYSVEYNIGSKHGEP